MKTNEIIIISYGLRKSQSLYFDRWINGRERSVFVSSDTHGQINELHRLLNYMEKEDILVLTGDLIDRGSEDVFSFLKSLNKTNNDGLTMYNGRFILFQQGNHEEFLIDFLVIFGNTTLAKYYKNRIDNKKFEYMYSMSERENESETLTGTEVPIGTQETREYHKQADNEDETTDTESSEENKEHFETSMNDTPSSCNYDQENGTLLTDLEYFKADPWITVTRGGVDAFNNNYISEIFAGSGSMDVSVKSITYYLAGSYTTMKGILFIPKEAVRSDTAGRHNWNAAVTLYVTDKNDNESVAYRMQEFTDVMRPEEINIDITGAEFLRIEFSDALYFDQGAACGLVCLGNPTVY